MDMCRECMWPRHTCGGMTQGFNLSGSRICSNSLDFDPCIPVAQGCLAFLNLTVERARPLLENASESTLVTTITAAVSHHDSLVGDPVIINSNPVVHPFVVSHKAVDQWELITAKEPKLDFEMVAFYTLVIYARDSGGDSASQTILIQIADVNEPPTFIGSLTQVDQVTEIYIPEDTPVGTILYRVRAKDPENAALKYFISPVEAGFTIDGIGTISTTMAFDFNRGPKSYSLIIKVADPGGLFVMGNINIFLINVNNKAPILTCSLFNIKEAVLTPILLNSTTATEVSITLDEEIPLGKTVGVCRATDEDQMGRLTFALDPGNRYFAIDKEVGTVMMANRLDLEEADFVSVQSFTIKACDEDQQCAAIPVRADIHGINDNPPFCDKYLYRYRGIEVIANKTVVAKLVCHDLDKSPDVLQYTPNSGPLGEGELFEQVPDFDNVIWVTKDLDYEKPETFAVGHTYEMMVSVFDDTRPSHTVTVTIIVEVVPANEFSPVFRPASYSFSVPETSGAFYEIGRVTAFDGDNPLNCVKYKIIRGDTQNIRRFWIHPLTGMIELITQPDYESVKQYNLTIEAVDCDQAQPRTAVTTVTIDIKDENDEAPVCKPSKYKAVIFDSVAAGTNVNGFKLSCHDRDSRDTEMRFEIVSGNENQHFGFDPTRGSNTPKLIVKNPFNFKSGADFHQHYHLVVHIIDDNLQHGQIVYPRTGTVMIDISVMQQKTPAPPVTNSEQRKGVTVVNTSINTYNPNHWYVPFIFTLMAVFLAGLLAWTCYLLVKYTSITTRCQKLTKELSKPKSKGKKYIAGNKNTSDDMLTGNRHKKVEVVTETTVYETVFDGEAIDPVTGNVYEYNSKSGARKWKKMPRPPKDLVANIQTISEKLPIDELTQG
ncbi:cadherin-related family member 3-like [Dromiciops gliroides]|uniref:cadherin-related family member 3-like n=1 Tax=Dromiciops gliroides TaxID=33562 RepID=UPI001CC4F3E0|nr:cadherin-related family member 3-like [Dromiciops gliroides]